MSVLCQDDGETGYPERSLLFRRLKLVTTLLGREGIRNLLFLLLISQTTPWIHSQSDTNDPFAPGGGEPVTVFGDPLGIYVVIDVLRVEKETAKKLGFLEEVSTISEELKAELKKLGEEKTLELRASVRVPLRDGVPVSNESVHEIVYAVDTGRETFETRNVGITVVVEANIRPNDQIILHTAVERVDFDRTSVLPASDRVGDNVAGVRWVPTFFTHKISTSLLFRDGAWAILGTGEPEVTNAEKVDIYLIKMYSAGEN